MNIFFLDKDPKKCVIMYVNKHVIKMILEHVQLLCSAHHVCGSKNENFLIPYKLTHKNHPCSIWVRKSLSNYRFLIELTECLLDEYTYRYGKIHKCSSYLKELKENEPNIDDEGFTPPAQAMPDYCKDKDYITAYRNYYFLDKQHIFDWKKREKPEWIEEYENYFI